MPRQVRGLFEDYLEGAETGTRLQADPVDKTYEGDNRPAYIKNKTNITAEQYNEFLSELDDITAQANLDFRQEQLRQRITDEAQGRQYDPNSNRNIEAQARQGALFEQQSQALLDKYGVPRTFTTDAGSVYRFNPNGKYTKVFDAGMDFGDWMKVAVKAGLAAAVTMGIGGALTGVGATAASGTAAATTGLSAQMANTIAGVLTTGMTSGWDAKAMLASALSQGIDLDIGNKFVEAATRAGINSAVMGGSLEDVLTAAATGGAMAWGADKISEFFSSDEYSGWQEFDISGDNTLTDASGIVYTESQRATSLVNNIMSNNPSATLEEVLVTAKALSPTLSDTVLQTAANTVFNNLNTQTDSTTVNLTGDTTTTTTQDTTVAADDPAGEMEEVTVTANVRNINVNGKDVWVSSTGFLLDPKTLLPTGKRMITSSSGAIYFIDGDTQALTDGGLELRDRFINVYGEDQWLDFISKITPDSPAYLGGHKVTYDMLYEGGDGTTTREVNFTKEDANSLFSDIDAPVKPEDALPSPTNTIVVDNVEIVLPQFENLPPEALMVDLTTLDPEIQQVVKTTFEDAVRKAIESGSTSADAVAAATQAANNAIQEAVSANNTTQVTVTNPDGSTTNTTLVDNTPENVDKTTNPDGSTTTVVTNKDGSTTTTTNNTDGSSTSTTTDANGNTVRSSSTDADGNETTTVTDNQGSTSTTSTDAEGNTTTTTVDGDGNEIVTKTDPDGNPIDTPAPDSDGDGIPDDEDNDIDGDGVANDEDFDPTDPSIFEDTTKSDLDSDGDGLLDSEDPFPDDPTNGTEPSTTPPTDGGTTQPAGGDPPVTDGGGIDGGVDGTTGGTDGTTGGTDGTTGGTDGTTGGTDGTTDGTGGGTDGTTGGTDGGTGTGTDGVDGANGQDGVDGQNGTDGVDGQNGVDGKDGVDGQNGVDGQDGVDGVDGKDGVDGQDGQNGQDGQDGADGQDGQDGKDGVSGGGGMLTGRRGEFNPQPIPSVTYGLNPASMFGSVDYLEQLIARLKG